VERVAAAADPGACPYAQVGAWCWHIRMPLLATNRGRLRFSLIVPARASR
jgi:hypothetical protein